MNDQVSPGQITSAFALYHWYTYCICKV